VAHELWERSPGRRVRREARERIVLFNLATAITVSIGVLTLYVALFGIAVVCASAVIVTNVLEGELGHPVTADNYLRLALLVSTLATIGGALGSALESDRAVREAAYGYRPDD